MMQGKFLTKGLKGIDPSFLQASGKRHFSPYALILLILPIPLFIIWNSFATKGLNVKKTITPTPDINLIVQTMRAEIPTETGKSTELPKIISTPTLMYTKTPGILITVDDFLETGLNPDQVMNVLRNLPAPGRIRLDRFDEVAIGTRQFKISFYFPPYGGINCDSKYNCGKTASGLNVMDGVGYYLACPSDLEFGTKIIIFDKEWICQDRGGAITSEWIDLLYPYQPYGLYWGQVVTVKIIGKMGPTSTITMGPISTNYPTITMTSIPTNYPTITMTPIPSLTNTQVPTNNPIITLTTELTQEETKNEE